MAGITPIPIARAKRTIATHFDLARRQQRIPVDLLARRCNMSIPTITKMLTKGDGSLETFLRVARVLGMLDSVIDATDPLVTPIGRARSEEDTPKRVRSL